MTGGTKSFLLNLGPDADQFTSDIEFVSIFQSDNASVVQVRSAYNMGGFSEDDLSNLSSSMKSTLENNNSNSRPKKRVHVFVQKYLMSYSNTSVSGIAVIDWCIEDDKGVLHQEVFFVAYNPKNLLINTLGATKNTINESIVSRIAEKSFEMSAANYLAQPVKYVHYSLSSALDVMPKSINGSMLMPAGSGVISTPTGSVKTLYQSAVEYESIDWESFLKNQKY